MLVLIGLPLFFFICGLIVLINGDIPPAVMGGSIRHTTSDNTNRIVGIILILPLIMVVGSFFGLVPFIGHYLLRVLWDISAQWLPLLAVITYYLNRYPRPAYGDPPILRDTDIPLDQIDIGQTIANKTYRPILLVGLSLFFPLSLLFAPLAIWRTTQAIKLSNEHQFAKPQRLFAQVMRVLALLTLSPIAFILWGPQIGNTVNAVLTPRPSPSPTNDFSLRGTPNPTPVSGGVPQIAFVSKRDNTAGEIYAIDPDTGMLVRLTDDDAKDTTPAWSPDGEQIVFASDRGGQLMQLYVMSADGSEPVLLTDANLMGDMSNPVWSPDGRKIVFSFKSPDEASVLYQIDADGRNPLKLLDAVSASWSPESDQLVYATLAGTLNIVRIRGMDETPLYGAASRYLPAWSPNGQWIAYIEADTLRLMRPDGSDTVKLDVGRIGSYRLSWSPDGNRIVFVNISGDLCIVNFDGSGLRQLTTTGDNASPAWQQP